MGRGGVDWMATLFLVEIFFPSFLNAPSFQVGSFGSSEEKGIEERNSFHEKSKKNNLKKLFIPQIVMPAIRNYLFHWKTSKRGKYSFRVFSVRHFVLNNFDFRFLDIGLPDSSDLNEWRIYKQSPIFVIFNYVLVSFFKYGYFCCS